MGPYMGAAQLLQLHNRSAVYAYVIEPDPRQYASWVWIIKVCKGQHMSSICSMGRSGGSFGAACRCKTCDRGAKSKNKQDFRRSASISSLYLHIGGYFLLTAWASAGHRHLAY